MTQCGTRSSEKGSSYINASEFAQCGREAATHTPPLLAPGVGGRGAPMGAGPYSPPSSDSREGLRGRGEVSRTQERPPSPPLPQEDFLTRGPGPELVNPEKTSSMLDPSRIAQKAIPPHPKARRGGAEDARPERLVLLYKLVIGFGFCGSGHCTMFPTRWIVRSVSFHCPSFPLLPRPLAAQAPPFCLPKTARISLSFQASPV